MAGDKTDAWMPLWIGAYLADTMRLTTIQHGAYLLLLMAYWREREALPDVDDELRGITKTEKSEWKFMRPVLAKFFKVADGVWWHKRVEQEIAAADVRSAKAKEKAQRAAQGRWGEQPKHASGDASSIPQALPQAVPKDMHDECPTPSPSPNGVPPLKEEPTVLVDSAESPAANVVKLIDRRIPCPAEKLLEAFHAECPTLARVMKLNANRRTHLTARWREVDADSKFQSADDGISVFTEIFRKVNASDFLSGRAKDWKASFDWLTESSTNFLKVCEGQYDNENRAKR